MRTLVRAQLSAALEALRAEGWTLPDAIDIPLEAPKRPEHGDLATNLAMLLSKSTGKKPREIADALVAKLTPTLSDESGAISSVEIAGPGFLNLRVRDYAFHEVMQRIFSQKSRFGHSPARATERVLVEFLSANPTGPLHIAHARGAIVGDALVRVMKAAGYDVHTEYYVNDAGQKATNFAWTLRMVANGQPLFQEAYKGAYITALAHRLKAKRPELFAFPQPTHEASAEELAKRVEGYKKKNDKREPSAEQLAAMKIVPDAHESDHDLAAAGCAMQLEDIRATIAKLRIEFDQYFSELSFVTSGAVEKNVNDWIARGLAEERDGALFFKVSEASGEEDKDRVLRKSSGDYTYFAADIAYHQDKLTRPEKYTRLIDLFGADHHGYVPRMRAGIEALGLEKDRFEVLLMQMVSLIKDGQPYKMSKSTGTFVTIDEVLEEIDASAGVEGAGSDALRYFLLSRSSDSPMEIDVDLAKKQSVDNPVFYAQMSHARMCQIIERARTSPDFEEARAKGLLAVPEGFDAKLAARLALAEEKDLLAMCDHFPQVVRDAADHRAPHRVLFFAQELAQNFASYYTRLQKVHNDAVLPQRTLRESSPDWIEKWDWEKTRARLMWLDALRTVYANALALAGVSAPDKMAKIAVDDAAAV